MTSVTHTAAIIIQKTWRGYLFAKALPHALAQAVAQKEWDRKVRQIKIYGPQWGDPPLDSELEGEDSEDEEFAHNCWGEASDDEEEYDAADVADYWREKQFDCR